MNIQQLLVRMRVPNGASEERLWNYYSDNGRIFEIRQFGRAKFLLGEFIPNGRIVTTGPDGDVYQEHAGLKEAIQNTSPNALCSTLREMGIDPDSVIRLGSGISLSSYYHDSLEAACTEISDSIAADSWYTKFVELSEDDRRAQSSANAFDSVQFWENCLSRLRDAQTQESTFKGCHTAIDPVLSPETKKSILSYLNSPSQAEWLKVRSTLITVSQTLWSSWVAFAPRAARNGNAGYPSADVLRKSIRSAITAWEANVLLRLEEAKVRSAQFAAPHLRKVEVVNGMR